MSKKHKKKKEKQEKPVLVDDSTPTGIISSSVYQNLVGMIKGVQSTPVYTHTFTAPSTAFTLYKSQIQADNLLVYTLDEELNIIPVGQPHAIPREAPELEKLRSYLAECAEERRKAAQQKSASSSASIHDAIHWLEDINNWF